MEEMILQEPQILAASVAVPTDLHYQIARALLLAGEHVLVEKPYDGDARGGRWPPGLFGITYADDPRGRPRRALQPRRETVEASRR